MTSNQIAYMNAYESRRHNYATEQLDRNKLAETTRSNIATERETNRSNLAKEHLNALNLAETHRSNLAREQETERSNRAKEDETKRSNFAKEAETRRSNIENENIKIAGNRNSAYRNNMFGTDAYGGPATDFAGGVTSGIGGFLNVIADLI